MGTAAVEKGEGHGENHRASRVRVWLRKCWEWARKIAADKDAQVYMAPNFKLDN